MHPGRLTGPKAHRSETSDARSEGCGKARLVNSTKKAARIAQNLRADKRIGVGAHLGAASPINGIGLPDLHPSGTRIRCDSLGMIRTLLLVRPIGIGRRGEEHGETHSGNEQSNAQMCQLDRRHGRSPSCCARGAVKYDAFGRQRPAGWDHKLVSPSVTRHQAERGRAGESRTIADRYRACAQLPARIAAVSFKISARLYTSIVR